MDCYRVAAEILMTAFKSRLHVMPGPTVALHIERKAYLNMKYANLSLVYMESDNLEVE